MWAPQPVMQRKITAPTRNELQVSIRLAYSLVAKPTELPRVHYGTRVDWGLGVSVACRTSLITGVILHFYKTSPSVFHLTGCLLLNMGQRKLYNSSNLNVVYKWNIQAKVFCDVWWFFYTKSWSTEYSFDDTAPAAQSPNYLGLLTFANILPTL